MKTEHSKFSYLADPIFISCLFLYAINKFLIIRFDYLNILFLCYFNDILLVPCCLPPLLFVMHKIKLRRNHLPPTIIEVIIPLVIWTISFEIIAPLCFRKGTSDIGDIFAYWLGGFFCWFVWNYKYLFANKLHFFENNRNGQDFVP